MRTASISMLGCDTGWYSEGAACACRKSWRAISRRVPADTSWGRDPRSKDQSRAVGLCRRMYVRPSSADHIPEHQGHQSLTVNGLVMVGKVLREKRLFLITCQIGANYRGNGRRFARLDRAAGSLWRCACGIFVLLSVIADPRVTFVPIRIVQYIESLAYFVTRFVFGPLFRRH